MKGLKVLWGVESMYAATTRYRVVIPSRVLRRKGYEIELQTSFDPRIMANFNYDLVCLQRVSAQATQQFLAELQKHQTPVMYDMDDDIFSIETSSPVYDFYQKAPHVPWQQLTGMRFCGGVTVSTERLKEVYKPINDNVTVIPNYMDVNEWVNRDYPFLSFGEGNVIMVWEGSATHKDSLALIIPTLQRLMTRYTNLGLAFVGLDRLPIQTFPADRTYCFGWGAYKNLQMILSACHIGLAPLANSSFNRAKSNLRIMEYACAGLSIVGSPHGEYTKAITDAKGVLCKTEDEWETALVALIESKKLRKEHEMNAKTWVANMDIRLHIEEWEQTWAKMMGV